MNLRQRITLVSAASVTIAVVLASVITYLLVSSQLYGQVDSQLRDRSSSSRSLLFAIQQRNGTELPALLRTLSDENPTARREISRLLASHEAAVRAAAAQAAAQARKSGKHATKSSATTAATVQNPFGYLPPRPNQVRGYQQLIGVHGHVVGRPSGGVTLPIDARTASLAAQGGESFLRNATVEGIHMRILAKAVAPGYAAQFAQPLTDDDKLLSRLRLILIVLDAAVILLAALLGRAVSGVAVAPVKRLTEATEHVARTRDLSRRIEPASPDEIGRLAISFNAMLDALERSMTALDASVTAQRQLVADASHELRTPVTSMRTNIEILQQVEDMDLPSRRRLLSDVVEQIEELTLLMNDLIDLARGDEPRGRTEEVRLDLLVTDAIARARRHAPDARFEVALDETLVMGSPARLDRAINNLLDNAVKYSPRGEPVEVALHGGELQVRDHGPGIDDEDLPHVFDRFYRGAEARGRPGSGLGLAIVRQVAVSHGGSITITRPPGGGTLMRLQLEALAYGEADEHAGERYVSPVVA